MKKLFALFLALILLVSLCACKEETQEPGEKTAFKIGIIQLAPHPALDAATQGFKDYLVEQLGEDGVVFDYQNAAGDAANCSMICNTFVSENVDLIMANATAALQAAASATETIPVLGTSISSFPVALGVDNDQLNTMNVSGTSDLAPLDLQAQQIVDIFPNAEKVAILFCSAEANSVFQADEIEKFLADLGVETKRFTFVDTNDIASVTQAACEWADVMYVPTDNVAANNAETINNVALQNEVPIVAGEENICKGCGTVTYSLNYYDLGYACGKMAYEILVNGEDVTTMPVGSAEVLTKKFNKELCDLYQLEIPRDYVEIE